MLFELHYDDAAHQWVLTVPGDSAERREVEIPEATESPLDREMVYECDADESTTAEGEPLWLVTKVGEVVAGPD